VVVDVSERNFEEAVEAVLTAQPGEDRESPGDAEYAPGGYYRRRQEFLGWLFERYRRRTASE
jgi:hypothetical protein